FAGRRFGCDVGKGRKRETGAEVSADPGAGAVASRETYEAWNSAVHREFFDGTWRDRPIYLDLEDDVLVRISRAAGGDGTDPEGALVRAVKPTLYLYPERERIFTNHVRRARMWLMTGAKDAPPFLAVLALLSVVAEKMRSDEQFRASNYYDRLCQALDIDPQLR